MLTILLMELALQFFTSHDLNMITLFRLLITRAKKIGIYVAPTFLGDTMLRTYLSYSSEGQ